MWGASTSNVKKWLHVGGQDEPAKPQATAYVADQAPSDVPLPPRRAAAPGEAKQRVAGKAPARPEAADASTAPDTTGSIPAAEAAAAPTK